ncbi:Plasmid conjugative transfer endonuclease [Candidatus Burkholderia brachyanthoides]|nr:Plasmid conjugative transfer endonuclease [Candidatus Burkholderia brachyanthoides]
MKNNPMISDIANVLPAVRRRTLAGLLIAFAVTHTLPVQAAVTCAVDVGYSPEGSAEQIVSTSIEHARNTRGNQFGSLRTHSRRRPSREHLSAQNVAASMSRFLPMQRKARSARNRQQATLNVLVQPGIPTRTISVYAIHHDKFIVVDGAAVETGSFNFSAAAARRNSENALLLTCCQPNLTRSYLNHWQSRWNQGVDYALSY